MNDYFISVVVPCYNVEKYIMRCVASLISQTIGFENMQVIFVNDASTDNTLSILRKIESAYPENVVLITYDKNLRQGGARNIGLSYATAKYVGFVDADDWIEPEMYEEMYNKMKCGNYDIVRCKSGADRSQEMFRFTPSIERFDQDLSFEKKGLYYWAHQDDKKTGVNGHLGGIWTGLYKKI